MVGGRHGTTRGGSCWQSGHCFPGHAANAYDNRQCFRGHPTSSRDDAMKAWSKLMTGGFVRTFDHHTFSVNIFLHPEASERCG